MADYSGKVYRIFPFDVPTQIGPAPVREGLNGPVVVKEFVWRKSNASTPAAGDTCFLKDEKGRTLFDRTWPEDADKHLTKIEQQGYCQAHYGMFLEALDSGVLEVWVE